MKNKKSTATRVQGSASQPTMGTTRTNASQADMTTNGSQPQATMGTTRAFNMRAQPQAAMGSTRAPLPGIVRTMSYPNSNQPSRGVMAKGKKRT